MKRIAINGITLHSGVSKGMVSAIINGKKAPEILIKNNQFPCRLPVKKITLESKLVFRKSTKIFIQKKIK